MSANGSEHKMHSDRLKYALPQSAKPLDSLDLSDAGLGQRNPRHCPQTTSADETNDRLGEPMTIRQVARMLGCSAWTIRQRYLPLGLPHFRLSPAGKLLFFHNQIVCWVLERQRQKGGMIR